MIFFFNKYQSVTHVSTPIFQGLFKNIVFKSEALVIKKVMGYFRFFSQNGLFFRPVPYPMYEKKKLTKKYFKLLFLKSQKTSW